MKENPICVAVTGAQGFLGQPTVAALTKLNPVIVAASRHGDKMNRASKNVFFTIVDITDRASWDALFADNNPTRLIHLAWDYLNNFDDPRHYLEQLPAHLAFLEWCVRKGISDITVAGTCYEYGLIDGELDEEMPTKPILAYPIAKDALRRSLEHLSGVLPFSFKWARIFYVRGDDVAEKGIFKHIRDAALKGEKEFAVTWGEQMRDYLPREEVGRFLAHFCLQNDILGIVNCCSGKPMAMRRLMEEYAGQWPGFRLKFGEVAYRPSEPMAFWGNRSRMDKVLAARTR